MPMDLVRQQHFDLSKTNPRCTLERIGRGNIEKGVAPKPREKHDVKFLAEGDGKREST